jgi:hypothetical protein
MNRLKQGPTHWLKISTQTSCEAGQPATAAKSSLKVMGWRELKNRPNLQQIQTRLFS